MAYITQAELLIALAPATMIAIFDDDSDGVLDTASVDAVIARASAQVDSWISPVYSGPFPIAQQPVPAMIRELTIGYATFIIYERHPEFTRTLGENQTDRYKRIVDTAQRLQTAVQRIPDLTSQPKPANVTGSIVFSDERRRISDCNGGDF